ncbi:MAG: type II toxin-antitoxin system PemK/MazF family toxin [Clostridia bacterium]|nr:type II toxin-antitoxin system PemK/MazF family toxin [Clostridia bacterium]MDD4387471.1 type II toxin-antitoxin system PemK/MazF family toxin [Clostridia bacterium]
MKILDVVNQKNLAVQKINDIIQSFIDSGDEKKIKKAALLSYWLKDYSNYLNEENNFDAKKYIRYERGSIVKINLGFNVGNEEGGLHYCVVIDNNATLGSGTLTVIPLSSYKEGKEVHRDNVLLGNTIYQKLITKGKIIIEDAKICIKDMQKIGTDKGMNCAEFIELNNKFEEKIKFTRKIIHEIEKMKLGSIALVNQITTISKMRIYNPKNVSDILYNVKLDVDEMDLINKKIIKLYIFDKKIVKS